MAVFLIRFNLKRCHILRCAANATAEQLETIYTCIDHLGAEPPTCAVLARTNRRQVETSEWRIHVPQFVESWGGREIAVDLCSEPPGPTFRFSERRGTDIVLRGLEYRVIPVPRLATKNEKGRNQFSLAKYVAGNSQLMCALNAVCPAYPTELLGYLLASGAETFEFDPMNQVKFGGSPSWVQDPEFPNCDQCGKRMTLIFQLPGTLLPEKPLPRGTFYFFGCTAHPVCTSTVGQYT